MAIWWWPFRFFLRDSLPHRLVLLKRTQLKMKHHPESSLSKTLRQQRQRISKKTDSAAEGLLKGFGGGSWFTSSADCGSFGRHIQEELYSQHVQTVADAGKERMAIYLKQGLVSGSQKGPLQSGHVKKRQMSRQISTIFDNFRARRRTAKESKIIFDSFRVGQTNVRTFRQLSTTILSTLFNKCRARHQSCGPFWGALKSGATS